MLSNPFCPLATAKVLALKATVLVLLTLLIKARVQVAAGSALGIFLLLLQTLVFLAVSGGVVLAAGSAVLYTAQQRKSAAACTRSIAVEAAMAMLHQDEASQCGSCTDSSVASAAFSGRTLQSAPAVGC